MNIKRDGTFFRKLSMSVFLCLAISCATAAEPLHYGAVGMYGAAWKDWIDQASEKPNFFIYQVMRWQKPQDVQKVVEKASKQGVQVLLDIVFYDDVRQKAVLKGAPPLKGVPFYASRFTQVLDSLKGQPILGVTLDEESNVQRPDRAKFLSELYAFLKQRYPEITFYQWYWPRDTIVIPGVQWPTVATDGWVEDQYLIDGEQYDQYMAAMKKQGKPIISVMWASPNWHTATTAPHGENEINMEWWNAQGWRDFYQKMAVNKKYDIPTAFYMYNKKVGAGRLQVPLCTSDNQCDKRFLDDFVSRTLPYIKSRQQFSEQPPKARPDWIPGYCD